MNLNPKIILNDARLNLLIGSGASRPHFETLNNIENAFALIDHNEESANANLARVLCVKRYVDAVVSPELEIGPVEGSQAGDRAKETLAGYARLISAVHRLVAMRESPIGSKLVNVFTTNYDTCIEYTFEELGIQYNDGFTGRMKPRFDLGAYGLVPRRQSLLYEYVSEVPSFNLFKVHGSFNWTMNDDGEVVLDAQRSSVSKCIEAASNVTPDEQLDVNDLDALSAFLDAEGRSITSTESEFLNEYKKLVIVSPTKRKFEQTLIDRNYYEMLRMLSNELEKENSVLLVVGFSFADEHIREIVARSLIQNPTLLVLDFCHSDNQAENTLSYKEFNRLPFGNFIAVRPGDLDCVNLDTNTIAESFLESVFPQVNQGGTDDLP